MDVKSNPEPASILRPRKNILPIIQPGTGNPEPETFAPMSVSLHNITRMFYLEPIALEESTMLSLHSVLWPRITGTGLEGLDIAAAAAEGNTKPIKAASLPHARKTTLTPSYAPGSNAVVDPRYYYTAEGAPGTAILPVSGMIMKSATPFQESCYGVVSTDRIGFALQQAVADKTVKNIVFDFNSPGGQVTGIAELANLIQGATQVRGKTVYGFTDTMAASAAYWLASQCDEIITTGSGQLGSIGTYLAFLNEKVKMQTSGVSLELFKSGTHKGLGLPGNDLTQQDRSYLQARVDDLNSQFVAAVQSGRPKISKDGVTHAAMYPGTCTSPGGSSINHGLADGLVSSFDEFMSLLS